LSWNARTAAVEALAAAAIGVAGAVLSVVLVDVSLGLLDGFPARPWRRIGHRLEDALPWLPLAALGGLVLHFWYRRLLAGKGGPLASLALFVRPFAHFLLVGMAILFALLVTAVAAIATSLFDRLRGSGQRAESHAGKVATKLIGRYVLPWLWVLMPVPGDRAGGGSDWTDVPSQRRMLQALPLLALVFLLVPGMESEATDERIDKLTAVLAGSFWFADYLLVAFLVVPRLHERAPESREQESAGQS
jgi:hypothetical protein